MIPYADFLYFGLLLYPVVPTVSLGAIGRLSWHWIFAITLLVILVQYWEVIPVGPNSFVREIWIVGGYAIFQWFVAKVFIHIRPRIHSFWILTLIMALAVFPLLVAKFLPLLLPSYRFGFLGISYVTFRSLDVIFTIEDRLISTLRPTQFFCYLLFFPTVSSGPVDRYRRFERDWKRCRARQEFFQDLDYFVHRMFRGFFYKFIVAYLIKRYWLDPSAIGTGFIATVSYMYAYTFYLFFDFAGYSAFAVGVSYLFGIHTPENFDRPFVARNIRDFWNRWHISLSTWFRDNVYMRFVLAATKGRWFKNRHLASTLGFCLSFGLMGLWHGTEWYYLLYGIYHASLLSCHEVFTRWNKKRHFWGEGRSWTIASILITFHLVAIGLLLFSGRLHESLNIF